MRLTLDEYSKQFKMSKEMINTRLRTKRLNYIIENGTTYIIVTQKKEATVTKPKETNVVIKSSKIKTTVATVISLYQKENTSLKNKIIQLEEKIDKLIDDKEQMLIHERDKLEDIYTKKDEQIKNILELVNAKIQMEKETQTIHEVEMHNPTGLVELKDHLKSLGIKSQERKLIKKRFLNYYDSDSRIIHKDGKLYLDFSKYDYSDLLNP